MQMVRISRTLLLLMAAVAAGGADPRRPVDELIDRVKGLPPEFAANLLLHVEVIVSKLPREERIALYEHVFRIAAHAQLPTPLQGTGFHTDTVPGFRQMASETGLDSLSLQYRAMLYMKALDPARLQTMFRDMRPLNLQPQSCQDVLRPDLSKWVGAISLVYHTGFTAKERAEEKDIAFVTDQVRAITSPLQLAGVLQLMSQTDRRLLPSLSAAYDSALAQVRGDWLAYQYANLGLGRTNAAAFREYVVAHHRGVRCGPRWPLHKSGEAEDVARFNQFVALQQDLNLQPIDTARLEPSRVEEGPKLEEFWKSGKSQRLLNELRWLTHGNRKAEADSQRYWTLEERRSVEWSDRLFALLKQTDDWSVADEPSPAAYFFMRSQVWVSLVKLVPPGPQRTNAFRNAISWFNASYSDAAVSRAEWWLKAKELLELAKKEPDLLDDLEQFGNAVLSAYAHIDNARSSTKPGGWAHRP